MELLCPAGNLASLKSALQAGADAVYLGLKDDTNARSFAGLNFTPAKLQEAAELTHQRGKKIFLTLNTFPKPNEEHRWYQAIDLAASIGVDALIVADLSLLDYAHRQYPHIPLHLSVQASATNLGALSFYKEAFNIARVVLPRVLSMKQVRDLAKVSPVDLEVFAFGSLCIMAEGRCHLSSYVTGQSPNTGGSCSPAKHVRWQEQGKDRLTRLNEVLIDKSGLDEQMGYPVVCKGRYLTQDDDKPQYLLESPTSLNTLSLLPELAKAGIVSLKIEGRQRSPAYVEQVTKVWRQAIDTYLHQPDKFQTQAHWEQALAKVSEGQITTLGAYERDWQ
ncbi:MULTISPECIES: ubiquinone anaerobic biosynthesis protein UbiU [Shewanella]|uniref:Ubiquinone biosynthesis protein UbiU n=1 Tax=Shewanella xiamenensis TaxID=332186 RepID=A0AAW6QRT6_9GAMM|nr:MULTISPECIES: peptidase U32 family protein [Shewanella]QXN24045.1 U32 family peptidase [Shewanella putrefaciens]KEK29242.1 peptidase U32 [Shewanella xiamenensis]MCD8557623.1 U32 family peptidase [Shewanella xiamenensis]MCH7421602.1 U32 family peptidase [Shewanella sp. MM_2022_3]MCT8861015.1 U32 family peptidase [Shewanella xiamenensis]